MIATTDWLAGAMKLVTFTADGEAHIGAALPEVAELVDFTAANAAPQFRTMLALIDAGAAALDEARRIVASGRHRLPIGEVSLAAPLPEPRQMRDFLVFEQHLRQARAHRHTVGFGQGLATDPAKVEVPKVWYQQPIYYKCNRFSVVGTGTEIRFPKACRFADYELEFGIVIGKRGHDIPAAQARAHIYGYTIFNDASARDLQFDEMQGGLGPCKGKDFDTGNVLGPWLVTADEIPNPYDLTMVARVNGQEWSRGNSRDMYHPFEAMIAHASAAETIHPGEFMGSGTVGSGCGLEHGRFLKDGDLVELEVEGLGILANRVAVG